ncbi:MAG: trimeric intracellular cation channel family protein [Thermoanaerobaculia bacterium]
MTLFLLNLIGVGVFAASGALAAGRKRMDWIGVIVLAVVTALGGGTIRDLLLDRHPVFWIRETANLWAALVAAGLTLLWVRFRRPPRRALVIADALGLAMFSIGGAQIAQREGLTGVVVVVMGAFTGVAGGVVRDVLSAEVPLLFRSSEPLYATAVIVGVSGYLGLEALGVATTPAALAGMALIVALRFTAILFRLGLPTFRLPEEAESPEAESR